eukprot:1136674-Pelagomonas_calceolata.AAC.9
MERQDPWLVRCVAFQWSLVELGPFCILWSEARKMIWVLPYMAQMFKTMVDQATGGSNCVSREPLCVLQVLDYLQMTRACKSTGVRQQEGQDWGEQEVFHEIPGMGIRQGGT